jgi:hypothetical protein
MLGTYRFVLPVLTALLVMVTACNEPAKERHTWAPSADDVRAERNAHLSTMVDNAILSDMSLADIHFIPHTAEISGVGEARLARMAKLLNTYGGTVRYETQLTDEDMIALRLDHVREYLALTGCDMKRVEVTTGLPGGQGMWGDEATRKLKQGTEKKAGTTGTTISPAFQGIASPQ